MKFNHLEHSFLEENLCCSVKAKYIVYQVSSINLIKYQLIKYQVSSIDYQVPGALDIFNWSRGKGGSALKFKVFYTNHNISRLLAMLKKGMKVTNGMKGTKGMSGVKGLNGMKGRKEGNIFAIFFAQIPTEFCDWSFLVFEAMEDIYDMPLLVKCCELHLCFVLCQETCPNSGCPAQNTKTLTPQLCFTFGFLSSPLRQSLPACVRFGCFQICDQCNSRI